MIYRDLEIALTTTQFTGQKSYLHDKPTANDKLQQHHAIQHCRRVEMIYFQIRWHLAPAASLVVHKITKSPMVRSQPMETSLERTRTTNTFPPRWQIILSRKCVPQRDVHGCIIRIPACINTTTNIAAMLMSRDDIEPLTRDEYISAVWWLCGTRSLQYDSVQQEVHVCNARKTYHECIDKPLRHAVSKYIKGIIGRAILGISLISFCHSPILFNFCMFRF